MASSTFPTQQFKAKTSETVKIILGKISQKQFVSLPLEIRLEW